MLAPLAYPRKEHHMQFIAFTPAALLALVNLAVAHRLTEGEACAVLRGLNTAHPHGIVSVATVEQVAGDVLVQACADALAARAVQNRTLDVVAADEVAVRGGDSVSLR